MPHSIATLTPSLITSSKKLKYTTITYLDIVPSIFRVMSSKRRPKKNVTELTLFSITEIALTVSLRRGYFGERTERLDYSMESL